MLERRCVHNLTPFPHRLKYINGNAVYILKNMEKRVKKARTKQQFVRVYDWIVFNIKETMLKILFLFHFLIDHMTHD